MPDQPRSEQSRTTKAARAPRFTQQRLNASTHRVVEDDAHKEYPFIYVKRLGRGSALLIDTGCGSLDGPDGDGGLRDFVETHVLKAEPGVEWQWHVLLTHCHFDHIGAIEQFRSPNCRIYGSSRSPSFTAGHALHASSLRKALRLPRLRIEYGPVPLEDGASFPCLPSLPAPGAEAGQGAGGARERRHLRVMHTPGHTPGHTPDSLSLYDAAERTLYTADLAYEWVPVVFPEPGGCVSEYRASLRRLLACVRAWNAEPAGPERERVKLAAGHVTCQADAEEILAELHAFLAEVLAGRVEGSQVDGLDEGEREWLFESEGGRFAFRGPGEVWRRAGMGWVGGG